MQTNTSLIIGLGEVGVALHDVLDPHYDVDVYDNSIGTEPKLGKTYDIIHICFPYSPKFIDYVKAYQIRFQPKYTIIHSTVKPGTCRELGAISSPVIGIHPDLEKSLKTFVKFLGGEQAHEVADYFRRAGMKVYMFDTPETPELMKILATTFYGICIEYTKDVKRLSDQFNVPFEAWKIWTDNYNTGYNKLGYPEFTRPNLVPIMKKIGGHCILNNTELLETKFTKFLKDNNA